MKKLIGKRFKVMVMGEFERTCNFGGLLGLLHRFSDFFDYTTQEQNAYWNKAVKTGKLYIDANITAIVL